MPWLSTNSRPHVFARLPDSVVCDEIIAHLEPQDRLNFAATCRRHDHLVNQYHGAVLNRYPEQQEWYAANLAAAPSAAAYAQALRPRWRDYVLAHPDMAAWRRDGAAQYTLNYGKPAVMRFAKPWCAADAALKQVWMENLGSHGVSNSYAVDSYASNHRNTECLSQLSGRRTKDAKVVDVLSATWRLTEHKGDLGVVGSDLCGHQPKTVWPRAHVLYYHASLKEITIRQQSGAYGSTSLHAYKLASGVLQGAPVPCWHATDCVQAVYAPGGAHVAIQFSRASGGVLVMPTNQLALVNPNSRVFIPNFYFPETAHATRPASVWLNDAHLLLQRATPNVSDSLDICCVPIARPPLGQALSHPPVQCYNAMLNRSWELQPLPGAYRRAASLRDYSGLSCAPAGDCCVMLTQRHANDQVDVGLGQVQITEPVSYSMLQEFAGVLQFDQRPVLSTWSNDAQRVAMWWGTQLLLIERTTTGAHCQPKRQVMATQAQGAHEMAFSPSGLHLALYTPQALQIYNSQSGARVLTRRLTPSLDAPPPSQCALLWSTRGTRLRCGKQLLLLTESPSPASPAVLKAASRQKVLGRLKRCMHVAGALACLTGVSLGILYVCMPVIPGVILALGCAMYVAFSATFIGSFVYIMTILLRRPPA